MAVSGSANWRKYNKSAKSRRKRYARETEWVWGDGSNADDYL